MRVYKAGRTALQALHTVRFHATQKIRKITELKKIDFGKRAVFQKVFDVAKI